MFILFINTRVSAYCSAVKIFETVELDSARSCLEAQSLETELENLSGRFSLRRMGKIVSRKVYIVFFRQPATQLLLSAKKFRGERHAGKKVG